MVWMARYLGPEQFGLLNFGLAFTGLFGALATLGLQGIVVRDLVRFPDRSPVTLGTSALLQFLGGVASFALIFGTIHYLRPNDEVSKVIVSILGAAMLFKASEISLYWFESQVLSKYTVWVQNAVFLFFAIIKVLLILAKVELKLFVWVILAEAATVAVALLVAMNMRGVLIRRLEVSLSRAKSLLAESWPLIISNFSVLIYMKTDQIMLGQMMGDAAVGIYSAATRVSEVFYFIPVIIVNSVFPTILKARSQNAEHYNHLVQKLFDLLVFTGFLVTLTVTFSSTQLIGFLFGASYTHAAAVLTIHICASIFVFLGVASNSCLLSEDLQMLILQRTVVAAIFNIMFNLILIPDFGAQGAALGLLASQLIASILIDGIQKKTRHIFLMKMQAMNPKRWIDLIL
jgi:O-antigen/teichoic acid export membrane protein